METETTALPPKTTFLGKELRLVIYIQKTLSPWYDYPAIFLHYLIKDEMLMLLSPISVFLFNYSIGLVLALTCGIVEIYAGIFKWTFRIPRPLWLDKNGELTNRRGEWESDYGFPSSHSMLTAAMTVITLLVFIDIKHDARFMKEHDVNEDRIAFLICFCAGTVLSLVTGLSRIYFAVHYPRDVIVGYMLGIIFGVSIYYLFKVTRDINEWASIEIGIALTVITLVLMLLARSLFKQDREKMPEWEANALIAWDGRKGQNSEKPSAGIHPRSIARYIVMYGAVFGAWIGDPIFRLSHNGAPYHECQNWTKTKGIRFGIGFSGVLFLLITIYVLVPKVFKRKIFLYPSKAILGVIYGLWVSVIPQTVFHSAGYNKCY